MLSNEFNLFANDFVNISPTLPTFVSFLYTSLHIPDKADGVPNKVSAPVFLPNLKDNFY